MGNVWRNSEDGEGSFERKKNANVRNIVLKLIYNPNFSQIGQWESIEIEGGGGRSHI